MSELQPHSSPLLSGLLLRTCIFPWIYFLFLFSVKSYGQDLLSPPAKISAPILILADAESSQILWERGGDIPIAPASLSKIMTLHLSLLDSEQGILDESTLYTIPPEGSATSMRPNSSILGLQEGDRATLLTLQRAAAIASANDAAWTLASLSSGGKVPSFIQRMNQEAFRLGMVSTRYTDPDGWSELSTSTGRDQLRLVLHYLKTHTGVLNRLHSLPTMLYQATDNLSDYPKISNTNRLIGTFPGADGLKTGTIPAAGYHFIATAQQRETRLIAIVMGIRARDFPTGLNKRAEEAALLLEWGFEHFETWHPLLPVFQTVPVRHGSVETLEVGVNTSPLPLSVKKGRIKFFETHIMLPEQLTAPVKKGEHVGRLWWTDEDQILKGIPLVALQDVEKKFRIRDLFTGNN